MDPFLLLALAEGFDEGLVDALLDPMLDPSAVLAAAPDDPCVATLPPRVQARLADRTALELGAAAVLRAADQHGMRCLTPTSADWPQNLVHMPLRPLVLFVRGDVRALQRQPALTFVGSRTPTPYGQHAATVFADALAKAGIVLWSGLARGIDRSAHAACTAARLPTIAILAGSAERIYPPEHADLARAILDHGGCLVSELPPGRPARRGHFPRRNRILAAGTRATLVIEASVASGALHTARFAAECGSSVYALPGPWSSERSQGCHRLIQEGAGLALDPAELLRDLGLEPGHAEATALQLQISADAQSILACLRTGPRPTDLVFAQCGLVRSAFLLARMQLEAAGLVQLLPGDLLATSR
jgi:DNA processing protein